MPNLARPLKESGRVHNAQTKFPPTIKAPSLAFHQPVVNEWTRIQTTPAMQIFSGDNMAIGLWGNHSLYPYENSAFGSLMVSKLVHIFIVQQLRQKLTHWSFTAPTRLLVLLNIIVTAHCLSIQTMAMVVAMIPTIIQGLIPSSASTVSLVARCRSQRHGQEK